MMRVPGFLLRRLYVKGSVRNTPHGFQFNLKNSLGSGYTHRMLPITVDDEEVPIERCSLRIDGDEGPFAQVSKENPFTLAMNRSITVVVQNAAPLSQEPHKIGMGFEVRGLGTLRFDFTDVPAQ